MLDSKMRRLVITKTAYNSGTFHFKETDCYISAAVIKSGSAVIGAISRASKGN